MTVFIMYCLFPGCSSTFTILHVIFCAFPLLALKNAAYCFVIFIIMNYKLSSVCERLITVHTFISTVWRSHNDNVILSTMSQSQFHSSTLIESLPHYHCLFQHLKNCKCWLTQTFMLLLSVKGHLGQLSRHNKSGVLRTSRQTPKAFIEDLSSSDVFHFLNLPLCFITMSPCAVCPQLLLLWPVSGVRRHRRNHGTGNRQGEQRCKDEVVRWTDTRACACETVGQLTGGHSAGSGSDPEKQQRLCSVQKWFTLWPQWNTVWCSGSSFWEGETIYTELELNNIIKSFTVLSVKTKMGPKYEIQ